MNKYLRFLLDKVRKVKDEIYFNTNDKLKFKIVSYSYSFLDTTLIKNFHFCNAFYYWIQKSNEFDRNNCIFDNIWLDIYKEMGEISYKLEDSTIDLSWRRQ